MSAVSAGSGGADRRKKNRPDAAQGFSERSIDPRTRLLLVVFLTAGALIFNKFAFLLPLLLLTAVLCWFFGGFAGGLLKRAKWLLGFFVFVAVIQSLFNQSGEVLLAIGNFPLLTTGGLWQGLCFLCRMSVIFLSAGILAVAGSRQIIQGMIQLKIPYELAFMTTCGLSFLPGFASDMKNSLTAMQLRGLELKKLSLAQKIKVYSYLLVPVLEGVIIKARELSRAMEMRAFRAFRTRSSYLTLSMKPLDYLLIAFSGAALAAGIILYFWGGASA
ncbi:MAG: energy-coupling factor transporter transmembrane protein EcfT [Clostridiales bacterium]|nr:energy-coupling factor transporter transmembrane protein EcfT [Clostridiales bacterium]